MSPLLAMVVDACGTDLISCFLSFHLLLLSIDIIVVLEILKSLFLDVGNSLCAPVLLRFSDVYVFHGSVCISGNG